MRVGNCAAIIPELAAPYCRPHFPICVHDHDWDQLARHPIAALNPTDLQLITITYSLAPMKHGGTAIKSVEAYVTQRLQTFRRRHCVKSFRIIRQQLISGIGEIKISAAFRVCTLDVVASVVIFWIRAVFSAPFHW